jgi:hypothetical protein
MRRAVVGRLNGLFRFEPSHIEEVSKCMKALAARHGGQFGCERCHV